VRQNVVFAERHRANPFVAGRLNHTTVERIVGEFGDQFGQFQNAECTSLKDILLTIEDGFGSGRVRLSDFYKLSLNGMSQLQESKEYLRQMGALDESNSKDPHVIVANYVNSPSNCLSSASFYSICCIDECEQLLGHLEQEIAAPTATPERIAELIENLPSSTVEAPRSLSKALRDRLEEVASHHEGMVPLHGRLFGQWMHHAFPRECPYPHVSGSTKPVTPDEWMETGNEVAFSRDQMEQYVEEACAADANAFDSLANTTSGGLDVLIEKDAQPLPWMPVEELVVLVSARRHPASSVWELIRPFMLLAALVSMVIAVIQTGMTSMESRVDTEVCKYQV